MSAATTTRALTEPSNSNSGSDPRWANKLRIGLDVAALLWPIILVYTSFRLVEARVALLERQVESILTANKEDHDLLIEIRTQLRTLIPAVPVSPNNPR